MTETIESQDVFLEILQTTLQDLYKPAALRKSPLLVWLAGDKTDPLATTRRYLTDAIKALKPGTNVPDHVNAWRVYRILSYRYLEQLTQKEVASELLLSVRQLRRLEHDALQVLADYLREHHALADKVGEAPLPQVPLPTSVAIGAPDRDDELVWLKKSLPDEVTDVRSMVDSVLRTIMPLADVKGVRISWEIAAKLRPVLGSGGAIRQALLSLLAAAVNGAPDHQVCVGVQEEDQSVVIHVRVPGERMADDSPLKLELLDKLQMTQQLCSFFGGELQVPRHIETGLSFAATLRLPASRPMQVLAIDDNVDVLRLLERYLDGTPYHFTGVSDPEDALRLAEEIVPQIVVLDVMLPGIDGWELLGRLRAHPVLQNTMVVICTILPQEQLSQALGAADFLRKPVNREALLGALNRLSRLKE